jgi:hypothetical protein
LAYARGVDGIWGMYQLLDRAPLGRNENGVWWRRHDEYDARKDREVLAGLSNVTSIGLGPGRRAIGPREAGGGGAVAVQAIQAEPEARDARGALHPAHDRLQLGRAEPVLGM